MNTIQQPICQGVGSILAPTISKLYAIFYKAANKGTVWYSPAQFQTNSYQTPTTWDGLDQPVNTIAGSGKFPWAMGVSSGSASGWPGADWIAEIFLNLNPAPTCTTNGWPTRSPGPIPVSRTPSRCLGRSSAATIISMARRSRSWQRDSSDASYLPFAFASDGLHVLSGRLHRRLHHRPVHKARRRAPTSISSPSQRSTRQYTGALTGGADVVSALTNNTAVQALVKYMATADAQEIWVKRGGFTAVNKAVTPSAYPEKSPRLRRRSLTSATIFRFGADDLMPSAVENAFWKVSYLH